MLTIDLGQLKDKNSYYHSFKTRLEDQPRVRLVSQVGLIVDPGQHKNKMVIINVLKSNFRVDPG
jgi:hypothetical protein